MPFNSFASESKTSALPKNRAAIGRAVTDRLDSARQTLSTQRSTQLIQPKLKIGAANDRYEKEADSVADQVMRMPEGQAVDSGSQISRLSRIGSIQRRCSGCQQITEQGDILQARALPGQTPAITPKVASGIQSLKGSGRPLSAASRGYFEPRFGHDFSLVRVHVDNHAAGMASSLGAKAFTLGQDVVFGDGQYQPDSREGRRLIAHELAHTVQQGDDAEAASTAARLSKVGGDRIQKDDDDDEERRSSSSGSGWRFQFGVGPMTAPSPSGPAADFFPPTEQLPIPGFLLNRGLGFQYSEGQFDFGVFPNLGGNTDFYGTRDIPGLLNPGSTQPQSPGTTSPQTPIPGQQPPPTGTITSPILIPTPGTTLQPPVPGTGISPQVPLRGLRERIVDRFVLNQSSLPSNAAAELDSMATWIKLARPAIVWVTGHTDVSGGEQRNQQLSEDRAASVRQALVDRGIDASVIQTSGEGESNPLIHDAGSPDQHARNRRVTIEWFDAVPPASGFRLRSPWLNR